LNYSPKTVFRNDLNYSIAYPFTNSSILYKKGNNAVGVGLGLKYYKQQIEDNIQHFNQNED
jgi:hypothetical protein